MYNKLYCVIMAGGKGERFWPQSREDRPKQLLNLLSPVSMLEQTVARIQPLLPVENILILTNSSYVAAIRKLLPEIPADNIIGEPARRDTAPCVALAAGIVSAKSGNDPEAVMMLLPADHCIVNAAQFRADLECAAKEAESTIVTIGIQPDSPSSDYGYIECRAKTGKVSEVSRFVEKPSMERAKEMLATDNYYWNAGMFIWQTGTIMKEFSRHAPQLAEFARNTAANWNSNKFTDFLAEEFPRQEKISIDYAILEKTDSIKVVRADFDWDDVGNWTSLRNHLQADEKGNIVSGNVKLLDCSNSIVLSDTPDELLTAVDQDNTIIIKSGNATLVCKDTSGAKIKKLLAIVSKETDHPENYL